MSNASHHIKPYDAGTLTKLVIYQSYLQAWLQVFLHTRPFGNKKLQFFDFFAGPGQDCQNTPGSPLILLNELLANRGPIFQTQYEPRIYFNDKIKWKSQRLSELCEERNLPWDWIVDRKEFQDSFDSQIQNIGLGPSLVFLDQFGFKHVTQDRFKRLAKKPNTDVIFFVASSFKKRFKDLLAPELNVDTSAPHHEIHRNIAMVYRSWAPKDYHVGHFSIKKGSNVYGLVFGSNHWLGMFKFLQIAWNLDQDAGQADFAIEVDIGQGNLFSKKFKRSRLDIFKENLKSRILEREFSSDADVFLTCIRNGILPSKAAKGVFSELIKEGIIRNGRGNQLRVSQEAMKDPREIIFKS